jgi:hypothetical protein
MPRIGVLVVAYNAETTLAQVLDRIPESFRPEITAVVVADDHSQDATYERGLDYQSRESGLPLTIIRRPRNLATAATRRQATAGRWTTSSTWSSCCMATVSTHPRCCRKWWPLSSTDEPTPCSGHA